MQIVGRFFSDVGAFRQYVDAVQLTGWRPAFVVVHNTSAPDRATYRGWRANPQMHGGWTPENWARNLASYYSGLGWHAGPHAFVTDDGVLAFSPLDKPGVHSPSWNSRTWGIETVGEFETEPFDGGVKSNLIAVLGILHARLGLDPADYKLGVRGLHYHKEDVATTHRTCPGRHMVKAELVAAVAAHIAGQHPGDHVDIALAVHAAPTNDLSDRVLRSVPWLQQQLNVKGAIPALTVDGVIGQATRRAVMLFQQQNGLVPDGIAGPLTRAKLAA